jgi:hypothetical protein
MYVRVDSRGSEGISKLETEEENHKKRKLMQVNKFPLRPKNSEVVKNVLFDLPCRNLSVN